MTLTAEQVVAAEDRVSCWIEQADEFAQAAMYRQLRLAGWGDDKAHRVVQQAWNHMGRR